MLGGGNATGSTWLSPLKEGGNLILLDEPTNDPTSRPRIAGKRALETFSAAPQ